MGEKNDDGRPAVARLGDASDSSVLSLPDPEKAGLPDSTSTDTVTGDVHGTPQDTNTSVITDKKQASSESSGDESHDWSSRSAGEKGENNADHHHCHNNNNNDDRDVIVDGDDLPTGATLTLHPSTATTVDFPEGGLTGWLVVLGSFCAMLSLFGLINSAAVFESYFTTHQLAHKTSSEIGWIFSLYLFIVFFVGIQVGPIFDRFGARALVAAGSTLIFLSLLLLSWCESTLSLLLVSLAFLSFRLYLSLSLSSYTMFSLLVNFVLLTRNQNTIKSSSPTRFSEGWGVRCSTVRPTGP